MKLSYRGVSYQSTPHNIETAESGITGHFLGQAYSMRRSVRNPHPSLSPKKYRGIAYPN